jgi:hypothetical protein
MHAAVAAASWSANPTKKAVVRNADMTGGFDGEKSGRVFSKVQFVDGIVCFVRAPLQDVSIYNARNAS